MYFFSFIMKAIRGVKMVVLIGVVAALPSLAISPPIPISPGTTNSPGSVLSDGNVTFRWQPVEEVTGYRVSVRDLGMDRLQTFSATAAQTNLTVPLTPGRGYRWNLCAFQGTNVSEYSETLYFGLQSLPILPLIKAVAPHPVPAVDGQQPFIIYGDNFLAGCSVVLRDEDSGQKFVRSDFDTRRLNLLCLAVGFTHTEARWSVEIINPGGFSSGRFTFSAVSPANMDTWWWWQSGWPWAISAGVLLFCALGSWFVWNSVAKPRLLNDAAAISARDERRRLCQDLHDGISGELALIAQFTEKTLVLLKSGLPASEVNIAVQGIRTATLNADFAIGDILWAAKPANEQLLSLVARLRERVTERLKPMGIESRCEFPVPVPERIVSAAAAWQLLQLTNEALNNVLKHSRATSFVARLTVEHDALKLTFVDNGCGFAPEQVKSGSRGLANLRARAQGIGGSVDIFSQPNRGTEVCVVLPLNHLVSLTSEITPQR